MFSIVTGKYNKKLYARIPSTGVDFVYYCMMQHRNFMAKSTLITALSILSFAGSANCQYYYKDLISIDQINNTFGVLKANKVSKVRVNSYQGNVAVTEGFECEQTVKSSANQVITYTKTADRGESYFTSYYNTAGKLARTSDSTGESISASIYNYDPANRLLRLSNETHAIDKSSSITEIHTWSYTPNGKPDRMIRVIDGTDTTTIQFTLDDKGNVADEESFKKGRPVGKIYYYYDDKNRLTDIVRYNVKAKRLLPDYIFEYEPNNELSVMTIVPAGSTDYQKWYYKYDDNGLRLADFCYNKKQELLGKIEYEYTFNK